MRKGYLLLLVLYLLFTAIAIGNRVFYHNATSLSTLLRDETTKCGKVLTKYEEERHHKANSYYECYVYIQFSDRQKAVHVEPYTYEKLSVGDNACFTVGEQENWTGAAAALWLIVAGLIALCFVIAWLGTGLYELVTHLNNQ